VTVAATATPVPVDARWALLLLAALLAAAGLRRRRAMG
jgi:MYXO-CTERM domain-containing protein